MPLITVTTGVVLHIISSMTGLGRSWIEFEIN